METYFNSLRLLTTVTKIIQSFRRFHQLAPPPPPPPPLSMAIDIDQRTSETAEQNPQMAGPALLRQHNRDWTMVSLSTAIEIALEAVKSNSQDPSAFHLFSLLILFAFAALFVSQFISSKLLLTAKVLDCVGLFIVGAAFCYAISITFPLSLKCITWTLFSISLLAIWFFYCYF